VLPAIIFVSALFAILYYLGVMQVVVKAFAVLMNRSWGRAARKLKRGRVHLHGSDRGAAYDPPVFPG